MTIKIDRDSIPRSYRDYHNKMVEMGEFFEIDEEIDWNLEMGTLRPRSSSSARTSIPWTRCR
jgi:hypothetical protein